MSNSSAGRVNENLRFERITATGINHYATRREETETGALTAAVAQGGRT